MFRQLPKTDQTRIVPYILIVPILIILVFVAGTILCVSFEREKLLLQGLTQGQAVPTEWFPTLWRLRYDLILVTFFVFLISAIGVAVVITLISFEGTKRTFEEVKGLARNIFASIPTGVITFNSAGQVTSINPSAVATLKRSTEELLGRSYDQIFPEGDMIRIVLDRALHKERHVDHHDLPYSISGQTRTIRLTTTSLTECDGRSVGVMVLFKDVTPMLDLEQRVRVADKLAGLHTLSAGVAHELRNPLSAIDLNLHLLEEELQKRTQPASHLDKYLHVLSAETSRMSAILDNFMKFARPGSLHHHAVDTEQLVSQIMALLQGEARDRHIQLISLAPDSLPSLMGDEAQISQVMINIIVNAFQAMPDGGLCHVIMRQVATDGTEWVEITVQDSGIGIKKEALGRLFEPFYTTKTAGSGLGLAISYRIVQDHKGTIQIFSTPGIGTSVVVTLPAVAAQDTVMVSNR